MTEKLSCKVAQTNGYDEMLAQATNIPMARVVYAKAVELYPRHPIWSYERALALSRSRSHVKDKSGAPEFIADCAGTKTHTGSLSSATANEIDQSATYSSDASEFNVATRSYSTVQPRS
jgi:hypothetical protein